MPAPLPPRPRLRASALAGTVLLALAAAPLPAAAASATADATATSDATGLPPTPAGSTHTAAPLDLDAVADVVLDEHRERLFFSSGPGHDTVVVTDLAGTPLQTLTGLPGATGLALGSDSLWVAAAESHELVELDAETLEVRRRVTLPADQCPGDVAVNSRYVVFGYSCLGYTGAGSTGGVGQFEHRYAQPAPVTSTEGPTRHPVVDAGQELSHRAVATEADAVAGTPSSASVLALSPGRLDVAATVATGGGVQDLSFHPWLDGFALSTRDPAEHRLYGIADDADGTRVWPDATVPPGGLPRATAWTAHGNLVTAGDDTAGPEVVVSTVRSTPGTVSADPAPFATFDLPDDAAVEPGGLVVDHDGRNVLAVTRDPAGKRTLHTMTLPSGSTLTVTGPGTGTVDSPVTLSGRLDFADGEPAGHQWLLAERVVTAADGTTTRTPLAGFDTDATGAFTLVDIPTQPGGATYTVRRGIHYDGHDPASASWTVQVQPRLAGTVALTPPATAEVGRALTLTGTLRSADGSPVAGGSLAVERYTNGTKATLPTVTTDTEGRFTVTDTPELVASTGYVVSWSTPQETAVGRLTVDVRKRTAGLELSSPAPVYVGQPVPVTGTLRYADGSLAGGQPLTVVRTLGGTPTTLPAVTTGSDGTFTITDTPTTVGTATYAVSYSSAVEAATASTSAEVRAKLESTLTVTAPATALAGSAVRVTGTLAHGDGSVGAGARVEVSRTSGGTTVTVGTATTTPNGAFAVDDVAPAAGTATYTARYAGDASHAPGSRTATTEVVLNPTRLTLTAEMNKKRVVTLTAHLGPTHASRVVRITAQPQNGGAVVLVEGTVDADGNLWATYTLSKTTTFTATYAGDGWNAPASASQVVTR